MRDEHKSIDPVPRCNIGSIDASGNHLRCTRALGHCDAGPGCTMEPETLVEIEEQRRRIREEDRRTREERQQRAIPADVRTAAALERIATAFEGIQGALRTVVDGLPNLLTTIITGARPRGWKQEG